MISAAYWGWRSRALADPRLTKWYAVGVRLHYGASSPHGQSGDGATSGRLKPVLQRIRGVVLSESEDVGDEVRELVIGKRGGRYRILFDIRGRTVNILRIWHSARDGITRDDL